MTDAQSVLCSLITVIKFAPLQTQTQGRCRCGSIDAVHKGDLIKLTFLVSLHDF